MSNLETYRIQVGKILTSVNPEGKEMAKKSSGQFVEAHISKIAEQDKEYGNRHKEDYNRVKQELIHIRNKAIEEEKIVYDEKGNFQYAISPNGRISNLYEFWWLVCQTKNFKKWYQGLNDENEEPLLLWHGTKNKFASFEKEKIGQNKDSGFFGSGFYLTQTRKLAEKYGGIVMPLVVNLKRYVSFSLTDRNARYREKGVKKSTGLLNGDPNARTIITGDHFPLEIHDDVLTIFEQLKGDYYKKMQEDSAEKASNGWGFISSENGDEGDDTEHLLSKAITLACLQNGYNGVIAENPLSQVTEIVIFDPEDIKSLDNLIFNPKDPTIYH